MEKEALTYSFVARGTMVVAEYTDFTGNFPAMAAQFLQRLPASNNKFVYNCDQHSFNFLLHNGYAYCVVAKESASEKVCISFLERVKQDFVKTYGGGKADTAIAKSLTKDFGPVMKEHMMYVIEHAEEIIKASKLKDQVSQVQNTMLDIDKILERGEIHYLVGKTEIFPRLYKRENEERRRQIRRKMWYQYHQNMKVKLVVIGILLMIALIIWLSIRHGFNCSFFVNRVGWLQPDRTGLEGHGLFMACSNF